MKILMSIGHWTLDNISNINRQCMLQKLLNSQVTQCFMINKYYSKNLNNYMVKIKYKLAIFLLSYVI